MNRYILIALLFIGILNLSAQEIEREVIGNAGDTYINMSENLTIDFTMGEVITKSVDFQNYHASQGFQQGNIAVSAIDENQVYDFNFYPNPAHDFIQFQKKSSSEKGNSISIYNELGDIVYQTTNLNTGDQIEVADWNTGIYIIKVNIDNELISTHKIIKQ